MQELKELQRQGMSIQAISELTGWDRKTIRKIVDKLEMELHRLHPDIIHYAQTEQPCAS